MRVNVQKRGKVYQYRFEIPKINGKRKFINKTRKEAEIAGYKAMDDYLNGGINSNSNMIYADYLDFWIKEYCEVEYKYTTIKRYKESLGAIKNELGIYKLRLITPYMINQALLKLSQKKLSILGLTEREANEFIIYWLPKLEKNKYNLIRFENMDNINHQMPLNIKPTPDTLIRVFMEYKPLDNKIDIKEQELLSPNREGFTVVEWGGSLIIGNNQISN